MQVKKILPSPWDGREYYGLVMDKIYKLQWTGLYWGFPAKDRIIDLFDKDKKECPNTHEQFIRQFEILKESSLNLPDWW